eukprot:g27679.t1
MEIFKQQPQEYIDMVLPNACRARVSIEASRRDSWGSLIGLDGEHVTQQQGTEPDLGALGILLGFWTHHWRITRILLVSTPG